jgi:hypothetical protein
MPIIGYILRNGVMPMEAFSRVPRSPSYDSDIRKGRRSRNHNDLSDQTLPLAPWRRSSQETSPLQH